MKVLFVTLNSFSEYSGGGIYARQLLAFLTEVFQVTALSKSQKDSGYEAGSKTASHRSVTLRKTLLADLVSRLLMQPTFLAFHLPKIIWEARRAKLIVFHNSRNAGLAVLLKCLFPHKPVLLCFDNIERNLAQAQAGSQRGLKRLVSLIDAALLRWVEPWGAFRTDGCSFITTQEKAYFGKLSPERLAWNARITPCALPDGQPKPLVRRDQVAPARLLFTGSFWFQPNRDALNRLIALVKLLPPGFEVTVAGQALDTCWPDSPPPQFHCVQNPSTQEMEGLFREADIFVCPVVIGSGMKTKIAEALAYGLPVVASEESAIGYEAMRGSEVLRVYGSLEEGARQLVELRDVLRSETKLGIQEEAQAGFICHYGYTANAKSFQEWVWHTNGGQHV